MKLFVVLGLGQFGQATAETLYAGGGDVLAIDADERRVERTKELVGQSVCMDATDIDALRAVGASKADTAVVALGEEDLEASILACTALADLGVGRIICRAANELQGRILMRVGATQVEFPEKAQGEQLAKSILMSGVLDQVTLPTGQTVARIEPRRELWGKTLRDADLRGRYQVIVIGIQLPRQSVGENGEVIEEYVSRNIPGPDEVIQEDCILIVVGAPAQIPLLARRD